MIRVLLADLYDRKIPIKVNGRFAIVFGWRLHPKDGIYYLNVSSSGIELVIS